MRIGYMTNAWGVVAGSGGGVTSIKDLYYISTGADKEAIEAISKAGFNYIEIFDGNIAQYEQDKSKFLDILKEYNVQVLGVYTGANFIFDEILDEELYKIDKTAALASEFGAKHLVLGGGAIRSTGIEDDDFKKLADGLDKAAEIAEKHGLIASYHPHLGTMVEKPEQLDKLMPLTKINLCPDTGHIEAGGGNAVETVRKYVDRIKYVHLKDYSSEGFFPLGKGGVNFKEIFEILHNNGFDGDFTIEADGYAGSPEEAAVHSYNYLNNLLASFK